jgi:hypothetical protein
VKKIQEAPVFQQYVSKNQFPRPAQRDDTAITVIARLNNSNPVKEVMPGIIDNVREVLGLEKPEKGTTHALRGDRPPEEATQGVPAVRSRLTSKASQDRKVDDFSEWEGFSTENDVEEGSNNDGSEPDFEEYDNLVASSESDADDGLDFLQPVNGNGLKHEQSAYDHNADMSLAPCESNDSLSDSLPDPKVKGKALKKPTNTAFLPSLMAGYWSGSDSGEVEATNIVQPKKNRPGQQARRLKWERKYGDKANHLQKQARDTGWDPRRGATDGDQRGKQGRGRNLRLPDPRGRKGRGENSRLLERKAPHERKANETGPNNDPVKTRKPKTKEVEGTLHPSWEAARKAKEQKVTGAFQGKKITFS